MVWGSGLRVRTPRVRGRGVPLRSAGLGSSHAGTFRVGIGRGVKLKVKGSGFRV
jgi:hypothetical protein